MQVQIAFKSKKLLNLTTGFNLNMIDVTSGSNTFTIIVATFFTFSIIATPQEYDTSEECGSQAPMYKILDGEVTAIDEFPWMALLEYKNRFGNSVGFGCSGTLLTNLHVLTTGHCIKEMEARELELYRVRLGEYNVSSEIDCIEMMGLQDCADPPQDILVDNWVVHESYNKHIHDIAVIKLNSTVHFTDFVRPICLPSSTKNEEVGDILIAAGWGRTETETSSSVKLKVNVPVVPFSSCYEQYKNANTILNISQHFCAGGVTGKDTCTGDSGGPLMTLRGEEGKWKIVGIISTGNRCGMEGWPAVYIRVLHYREWIIDQINSL